MSRWRQPWARLDLAGRRCSLQILDPQTALELEPQLAEHLGDRGAKLITAPQELLSSAAEAARVGRIPVGDDASVAAIVMIAESFGALLAELRLDGEWLAELFERTVLERIRIGDTLVETHQDWDALRLRPLAKWQVIFAQLRQSFGPLWQREPYKVRLPPEPTNVPSPKGVPLAVQYASNLAKQGHAPSMIEILQVWTPLDLIHAIENATYLAATERESLERAKATRAKR